MCIRDRTGTFNGLLTDSIVVQVILPNGTNAEDYKVIAATEFGRVLDDTQVTENGTATFRWELGCGENQALNFWLFGIECDDFSIDTGDCPALDSVVATANAIQEIGWVEGCGLPDIDLFDAQFEESEFAQFLLVDNICYRSNDSGLSWSEVSILNVSPESEDLFIVDIEVDPSNGLLYGITNDHVLHQEINFVWAPVGAIGDADINSELGGFVISNNNIFAAFGDDGIFVEVGGAWRSASQTIGFGQQMYKLEGIGNNVVGVFGSDNQKEIIYKTGSSAFNWEIGPLPANSFTSPFGDFLLLPDQTAALASGISATLTEFVPSDMLPLFTNDYIPNNAINTNGRSIKDLNLSLINI